MIKINENIPLEEMTDKHIGKKGTKKSDDFDHELWIDLLGEKKEA